MYKVGQIISYCVVYTYLLPKVNSNCSENKSYCQNKFNLDLYTRFSMSLHRACHLYWNRIGHSMYSVNHIAGRNNRHDKALGCSSSLFKVMFLVHFSFIVTVRYAWRKYVRHSGMYPSYKIGLPLCLSHTIIDMMVCINRKHGSSSITDTRLWVYM